MREVAIERGRAEERYQYMIQGTQSLDTLAEIQGVPASSESTKNIDNVSDDAPDNGWEDVTLPDVPDHTLEQALRDAVDSRYHSRVYADKRTWRQRIRRLHLNWEPLLPSLTDAYLIWKYNAPPAMAPDVEVTLDGRDTQNYDFTIDVVDIFTLNTQVTIRQATTSNSVAKSLVCQGYLGATPDQPTIALSLRTLDLFLKIKKRKPSFSVDAFAKVLCDVYSVPFRRRYRDALSNAFDAYLGILRMVDKRIAKELGCDGENWRVLNACPPCTYELEDEQPLRFSRMIVVNGNNSLKRVKLTGERTIGDDRTFEESDYYLSQDYVDRYAHEVKSRPCRDKQDVPDAPAPDSPPDAPTPSLNDVTDDPQSGDPTDGVPTVSGAPPCAENWKAAAADANKKMWAIFEEAGIFASCCRHGLILWIMDMLRSGELAKYPLALVAKALAVLPPAWLLGYDIGCIFKGTIERSSLGPLFREKQFQNHPNVIEGMGLEDLETLERVFSSSNQLGGVTRYMSRYRRCVFIDMFFQQWDAEKYENLATMLYNNYVQALRIIEREAPELEKSKVYFNIQPGDLAKWRSEELEHFSTLGQEPEEDILKITYVELLIQLREINAKHQKAHHQFLLSTPQDAASDTYANALSQTRKRETERRYTSERQDQLTRDVIQLEAKLGITTRWDFSSDKFHDALQYMTERKYHQALDKLQKLVVQRLFELHKLNLNYTAYSMRSHIAKSLQSRCNAIRNAVAAYNAAALALNPPKPTLDWSHVSHYTFLEEFNILRDTRHDIQQKPWAQLVIREIMKQDLKVQRAREELIRCNVEIRRLHTAIVDEHNLFSELLPKIQMTNSCIYGAVNDFVTYRRHVNNHLLNKIHRIYSLRGYTGTSTPGTKK
ncbi:hypothetical protein C0992_006742, partial [Termitomyces sp. T32_za158]